MRLKERLRHYARALTNQYYAKVVLRLKGDVSDEEKVARMYEDEICANCTDKELQFILWCHEQCIFGRAEYTLDAIRNELVRRGILEYDPD